MQGSAIEYIASAQQTVNVSATLVGDADKVQP